MPSCVCALVVHDCDLGFNLPAGGTPALLVRSQWWVARAWMGRAVSIANGDISSGQMFRWEYPLSCRHSVLADGVLWNMACPVKHVDGPP